MKKHEWRFGFTKEIKLKMNAHECIFKIMYVSCSQCYFKFLPFLFPIEILLYVKFRVF